MHVCRENVQKTKFSSIFRVRKSSAPFPGDVFQYARDKLELPANVPLALYEEVHAGRTDELTPTKHLNDVSVVFCTWLISLLTMKDTQWHL